MPSERSKLRIEAGETIFLSKIDEKTKMDGVKNEVIRNQLYIGTVKEKIVEGQLKWFVHV